MWQDTIYKGKLFKFNHSFAWKSMWQVVYELCCSGIKITFNFKLKLVFIEKRTGRKTTYKLIQEATSNLKLKCKMQGLYNEQINKYGKSYGWLNTTFIYILPILPHYNMVIYCIHLSAILP